MVHAVRTAPAVYPDEAAPPARMPPRALRRIQRGSWEWEKAWEEVVYDTRSFDNVPKLAGPSNWNRWYLGCKNAARAVGLLDLFLGKKLEPREPIEEEYTNDDDWNQQMLMCARFERQNQFLFAMLLESCAPHIAQKVENLESAQEALKALEKECTTVSFSILVAMYEGVHNCKLQDFQSFEEFLYEFNDRFDNFNRMRSSVKHDNDWKVFIFATSLGPLFADWIKMIEKTRNIAGTGRGEPVFYDELSTLAANHWESIKRSNRHSPHDKNRLYHLYSAFKPSVNQSKTGTKRNASAAFDGTHQHQGRQLLGPPNEVCALDYHGGHTNSECKMQKRPNFDPDR